MRRPISCCASRDGHLWPLGGSCESIPSSVNGFPTARKCACPSATVSPGILLQHAGPAPSWRNRAESRGDRGIGIASSPVGSLGPKVSRKRLSAPLPAPWQMPFITRAAFESGSIPLQRIKFSRACVPREKSRQLEPLHLIFVPNSSRTPGALDVISTIPAVRVQTSGLSETTA
jgi:hypothetical protein